jgi:type I restriction enzyme, R subunit
VSLNESIVKAATLESFEGLGHACTNGLPIAPGEPAAERDSFGEVVLVGRLREAIWQLNPAVPDVARATIRQFRRGQIERSAKP